MGHADAARPAILGQLDRADDEDLADRAAPALRAVDGIVPGTGRSYHTNGLNR